MCRVIFTHQVSKLADWAHIIVFFFIFSLVTDNVCGWIFSWYHDTGVSATYGTFIFDVD